MIRLDKYLVENNIARSRQVAAEYIKNNFVLVNGKPAGKCSLQISDTDKVEFVGEPAKFVGRGGLKLKKALEYFNINCTGKTCLDIGASTGGFTDCMLQNGAEKVVDIDVGSNQLHEKIKNDKRVIFFENTDIRTFKKEEYKNLFDFITCDVSFISFEKIFDSVIYYLKSNGIFILLLKPQFEVGKQYIGKNGIVKDVKAHLKLLNHVNEFIENNDCCIKNACKSPIRGGSGNVEYLLMIQKNSSEFSNTLDFKKIVNEKI